MTRVFETRRSVILAGAAAGTALAMPALIRPAQAAGLAPTPTMRGGANNYRPGAPLVERIGGGGFTLSGTVRRAGDGAALPGVRIQMWAHTTEGHERDERSHGATLTDENGVFTMDMPQIVPAFGQPHGHLAYDADFDDNGYKTVFLRPIMDSARDTSLTTHFVLEPA
ncbi:MAG: Twin-arginine translocation pathway signal [Pseudomonadota bacterium]